MRFTTIVAALALVTLSACGAKESKPADAKEESKQAESSEPASKTKKRESAGAKVVGKVEIDGGFASLDELGKAVVEKIVAKDAKALSGLLLDQTTYLALYNAKRNGQQQMDATLTAIWSQQAAASHANVARVLATFGGKPLTFVRIENAGQVERPGIVEYKAPRLVVKDEAGAEQTIDLLGVVIEHPASKKFVIASYGKAGRPAKVADKAAPDAAK